MRKREDKVGGGSGLKKDTIKRKINALRNQKLKIGYWLALSTGLRVFEVAKLTREDIQIKDNEKIIVRV